MLKTGAIRAPQGLLSGRDLAEPFGRQLEEQGWLYDAGWSGRLSTGSSWSANSASDVNLVGLLDIPTLEDARYQASFRLTGID